MVVGEMTSQTSPWRCLVLCYDRLESQKHGDHPSCTSADSITTVLQAKREDGRMHVFGGSNHGLLLWLAVQVAKE